MVAACDNHTATFCMYHGSSLPLASALSPLVRLYHFFIIWWNHTSASLAFSCRLLIQRRIAFNDYSIKHCLFNILISSCVFKYLPLILRSISIIRIYLIEWGSRNFVNYCTIVLEILGQLLWAISIRHDISCIMMTQWPLLMLRN